MIKRFTAKYIFSKCHHLFCFRKQVTLRGNVGYFSRLPPTPKKNESCGIIASCCLLGTLSRPEGRSNTILFQVWPKLCSRCGIPPKVVKKSWPLLLLMGKNPAITTWDVKNPVNNGTINYQTQLVIAGFLAAHQQYDVLIQTWEKSSTRVARCH